MWFSLFFTEWRAMIEFPSLYYTQHYLVKTNSLKCGKGLKVPTLQRSDITVHSSSLTKAYRNSNPLLTAWTVGSRQRNQEQWIFHRLSGQKAMTLNLMNNKSTYAAKIQVVHLLFLFQTLLCLNTNKLLLWFQATLCWRKEVCSLHLPREQDFTYQKVELRECGRD